MVNVLFVRCRFEDRFKPNHVQGLCMCVVYMCKHVHLYTYTHKYIYIYICMYICMYLYIYTYHVYVCTHVHLYTHAYICICVFCVYFKWCVNIFLMQFLMEYTLFINTLFFFIYLYLCSILESFRFRAPTTPTVHSTTISRFPCNFFPRMAPHLLDHHDSPSNLAKSRYPRYR